MYRISFSRSAVIEFSLKTTSSTGFSPGSVEFFFGYKDSTEGYLILFSFAVLLMIELGLSETCLLFVSTSFCLLKGLACYSLRSIISTF
jgi:hypothetical protein